MKRCSENLLSNVSSTILREPLQKEERLVQAQEAYTKTHPKLPSISLSEAAFLGPYARIASSPRHPLVGASFPTSVSETSSVASKGVPTPFVIRPVPFRGSPSSNTGKTIPPQSEEQPSNKISTQTIDRPPPVVKRGRGRPRKIVLPDTQLSVIQQEQPSSRQNAKRRKREKHKAGKSLTSANGTSSSSEYLPSRQNGAIRTRSRIAYKGKVKRDVTARLTLEEDETESTTIVTLDSTSVTELDEMQKARVHASRLIWPNIYNKKENTVDDRAELARSRMFDRHRERAIRRQRRLECLESKFTKIPPLLSNPDEWYIYDDMFPKSGNENRQQRIHLIPKQHLHRLTLEHFNLSYCALAESLIQDFALAQEEMAIYGLRSRRSDNIQENWGLRGTMVHFALSTLFTFNATGFFLAGLLFIATHTSEVILIIHRLEKSGLRTDEGFIRWRCARVLKKVLWHITKLEGCSSELHRFYTETNQVNENRDQVIVLLEDGLRCIERIMFLKTLLEDLSGLSDILEECNRRNKLKMKSEVYELMAKIKARPKSYGEIPGGIDDQELHQKLQMIYKQQKGERKIQDIERSRETETIGCQQQVHKNENEEIIFNIPVISEKMVSKEYKKDVPEIVAREPESILTVDAIVDDQMEEFKHRCQPEILPQFSFEMMQPILKDHWRRASIASTTEPDSPLRYDSIDHE